MPPQQQYPQYPEGQQPYPPANGQPPQPGYSPPPGGYSGGYNGGYQPSPSPSGQHAMENYEFILNNQVAAKKLRGGSGGRGSMIKRILILGGVLTVLIIAAVVVTSILNKPPETAVAMQNIAVQQAEIIRVAAIGEQKGSSAETRLLAATTRLGLTTDQSKLLAQLKKEHIKFEAKALTGGKVDATTSATLSSASANNLFDDRFNEILTTQLTEYQKATKNTYNISLSRSEKTVLGLMYDHVDTLLGTSAAADTPAPETTPAPPGVGPGIEPVAPPQPPTP